MIDLYVCIFQISFSAFNRGLKNQHTASGPDPRSLLEDKYMFSVVVVAGCQTAQTKADGNWSLEKESH